MITIIYSTQHDGSANILFKKHLMTTCGVSNPQIIEYVNNNAYSLSSLYNKGISEAENEIIVCLHNDVKLENGWGVKLLNDFENNPEYGIIGMAGTCNFPINGIYWNDLSRTMAGRIYHKPNNGEKFLSEYSAKLDMLIPVVSIDGLFIAFNKNKIKHTFDETSGKFNFYDHSFCLLNYLAGVKIGVSTSFEIIHDSVGNPNEQFQRDRINFLNKFGQYLPIDLKPETVFVEPVKEIPLKGLNKVAVIIPTKGKTELLFDCIDSYIEFTKSVEYEIFIADTGSTDKEKETIRKYIQKNSENVKINLIEYDYYNFAKINNDVVKNHVDSDFQFLVFSNNDIKLLNNVVHGMLKIHKNYSKVGTVGPRMHFADNTIQHNGILAGVNNYNTAIFTHLNLGAYYRWHRGIEKVFGNTAGLMMINKQVFISCGYFNENYENCFEDVELNGKCLLMGLTNYNDSNLVSYHYESQTRDDDADKMQKVNKDYNNNLLPFIAKNIQTFINKRVMYRL